MVPITKNAYHYINKRKHLYEKNLKTLTCTACKKLWSIQGLQGSLFCECTSARHEDRESTNRDGQFSRKKLVRARLTASRCVVCCARLAV